MRTIASEELRHRTYSPVATEVVQERQQQGRIPLKLLGGYICKACKPEGVYYAHISTNHAANHGFTNVSEMIKAGVAEKRR